MDPFDPAHCPLCGRANACAMANVAACGERGACRDCWCARVVIPPAVIARIPAAARDVACVCAACARGEPAPVQDVGRARD